MRKILDSMVGPTYSVLIIISIFIITYSCTSFKDDDKDSKKLVQFIVFKDQEANTIVVDTVVFNLIVGYNNEHTIFKYKNDIKKEIYIVNFGDTNGYMMNSNDTVLLRFIDKYDLVLLHPADTTCIYKFITLSPGIDNAQYLYFTPELGLILKKSTTWPIFSELSGHYLDKENRFNLFLSLIYNDNDFYNDIYKDLR